jgi:HK97 family phage major capsid protein
MDEVRGEINAAVANSNAEILAQVKALADTLNAQQTQPPMNYKHAPALFGGSGETPAPFVAQTEPLEKGIGAARFVKVMHQAGKDVERALFIAEKQMYQDDARLHHTLKSLGQNMSTPEDGGYLIPTEYSNEIIGLLRERSLVGQLPTRNLPVRGKLTMHTIEEGCAAQYIGEMEPLTKTQVKFGQMNFNTKKLGAYTPISNDLLRYNSVESDAVVRDELLQALSDAESYSFLYGKGTEYTPKGLFNQNLTNKSAVNGTLNSDDLAIMKGELMTQMKNNEMTGVRWLLHTQLWVWFYNLKGANDVYLHRAEMDKGLLMGVPFVTTNHLKFETTTGAPSDLVIGDFSNYFVGRDGGIEFALSTDTSFMSQAGVQSAFMQDMTVLRVINRHDFNIRRKEAFVVRTKVNTQS